MADNIENCCRYCGSYKRILYYYESCALCKQCFLDECVKTMPKLPRLCSQCGEMDSNNFYKGRSSKCKKCYSKGVLEKRNTQKVEQTSPVHPSIRKKKIVVRESSTDDE